MKNTFKQMAFLCAIVPAACAMQDNNTHDEFKSIINTLSTSPNNRQPHAIGLLQDKYEWASVLHSYSRAIGINNGYKKLDIPVSNSILILHIPACDIDTKISIIELCKEHYNTLIDEINSETKECASEVDVVELSFSYELLAQDMHHFVKACEKTANKEHKKHPNRFVFNSNNLYIKSDGLTFMTYA